MIVINKKKKKKSLAVRSCTKQQIKRESGDSRVTATGGRENGARDGPSLCECVHLCVFWEGRESNREEGMAQYALQTSLKLEAEATSPRPCGDVAVTCG